MSKEEGLEIRLVQNFLEFFKARERIFRNIEEQKGKNVENREKNDMISEK